MLHRFFTQVYEPAEDTFLLLDSLEADEAALLATGALVRGDVKDGDAEGAVKDGLILEDLSLTDTRTDSRTGPRLCLEVGSGSGVVITFLAQLVQKLSPSGQDCRFIATDLNPACVAATGKTAEENGVGVVVDAVQCDLVAAVMDDVAGKVDVLVFNPPYVVTPSSEVGSQGIEASWAGGVDGREVTDRLLPLIPALLAPRGLFYLVALDENFKEGTPGAIPHG